MGWNDAKAWAGALNSTVYGSGTDSASDPDLAWYFYSFLGFQDFGGYTKDSPLHAVAVRDGDVPVQLPEPQSLALGPRRTAITPN